MEWKPWWSGAFHIIAAEKKQIERGQDKIVLKDTPPGTYFLQPGPTPKFYYFILAEVSGYKPGLWQP